MEDSHGCIVFLEQGKEAPDEKEQREKTKGKEPSWNLYPAEPPNTKYSNILTRTKEVSFTYFLYLTLYIKQTLCFNTLVDLKTLDRKTCMKKLEKEAQIVKLKSNLPILWFRISHYLVFGSAKSIRKGWPVIERPDFLIFC